MAGQPASPSEPHSIFISYSHRDEGWKDLLLTHLEPFVEGGRITAWHDRIIGPGEEWYEEIREAMARATLAVCLLSPDFLTSDFCTREEVGYLLDRRRRHGLRLVPILVRPCAWESVPWMSALQHIPHDPIADTFSQRDAEAFAEVAGALAAILDDPDYHPLTAPRPQWSELEERWVCLDRLPITGHELFGRLPQLQNLDLAWKSPGTRVMVLWGRGGVGKSTLVGKWLDRMKEDNYRGATRVFGWSFYSEGAGQRPTSAHEFIVEALKWLDDPKPTDGSPWDKAERLGGLMRRQKTLLVLDGLEPLQAESEAERGRITDPALATLFDELASGHDGLCVVTTREPLRDLQDWGGAATHENLERVSTDAGRAILRVGRVVGSDHALEALSGEFGCDALALKLLAAYLRGTDGRKAANAAAIPPADVPQDQGRHTRRVLAALAHRFRGLPELEALSMLALFDRPAPAEQVRALLDGPAIPCLTERVSSLDDGGWPRLMDRLRDQDLVAFNDPAGDIDTHPIVRRHFATELRDRFPDAWRQGHDLIYEHLTRTSDLYPETIEAMMPLFRAISHGCEAGRWKEAAAEVFFKRIQRGTEDFASVQLGASGPLLAALANFFATRWSDPQRFMLDVSKQAYVLSQAAGCLKRLGRYADALQAQASAFHIDSGIAQSAARLMGRGWDYLLAAGKDANSIAELVLVTGPLSQAGGEAQEAAKIVHQAGDRFWLVVTLTTLGEVYHRMNRPETAEERFRLAESIHRELPGRSLPFLYNRQGFRYCRFLHDQGKYQAVLERASQAVAAKDNWPIDTALDHLSLGRAHLALGDPAAADPHLEAAINQIRYLEESEFLAQALLARAALRRAKGAREDARADVERAIRLTRWQGARLLHVDCRLARAGMNLEDGDIEPARADLDQAKELIAATDYHVRDTEVRDLERRL